MNEETKNRLRWIGLYVAVGLIPAAILAPAVVYALIVKGVIK